MCSLSMCSTFQDLAIVVLPQKIRTSTTHFAAYHVFDRKTAVFDHFPEARTTQEPPQMTSTVGWLPRESCPDTDHRQRILEITLFLQHFFLFFLASILMPSTYTDKNNSCSVWTWRHSHIETRPILLDNTSFLRKATRSLMLFQLFGRCRRGHRLHMFGNSSSSNLDCLGATSMWTNARADTPSLAAQAPTRRVWECPKKVCRCRLK